MPSTSFADSAGPQMAHPPPAALPDGTTALRRPPARERVALLADPYGSSAIAYHQLCDRLISASASGSGAGCDAVLLTGAGADVDYPVCAANLALALAEVTVQPALLLELDVRNPRLAELLAIDPPGPLCERLVRDVDAPLPVVSVGRRGLHVAAITPGERPPERLQLAALASLFRRARSAGYRWIIANAAPAQMCADALLIADCASMIVLVATAGRSTGDVVRAAAVEFGSERITGLVLMDA